MCRPPQNPANIRKHTARRSVPATFVGCVEKLHNAFCRKHTSCYLPIDNQGIKMIVKAGNGVEATEVTKVNADARNAFYQVAAHVREVSCPTA